MIFRWGGNRDGDVEMAANGDSGVHVRKWDAVNTERVFVSDTKGWLSSPLEPGEMLDNSDPWGIVGEPVARRGSRMEKTVTTPTRQLKLYCPKSPCRHPGEKTVHENTWESRGKTGHQMRTRSSSKACRA